jgi:hypothetical protein
MRSLRGGYAGATSYEIIPTLLLGQWFRLYVQSTP